MHPTGSFDRFENDIIRRYNDYDESDYVTFGILIADPRQTDAKQYIYNYLDHFNEESENYFDFFIPGYTEYKWPDDAEKVIVNVNNTDYYFSYKLFEGFLKKLKLHFGIEYTFNPMLILMSMIPGQIYSAKYIVIELDNTSHDIRRSGMVFSRIFEFARMNPEINNLQRMFVNTYLKGNWLNHILKILNQNKLLEAINIKNNITKYRIR